jgi:hypothetical protein
VKAFGNSPRHLLCLIGLIFFTACTSLASNKACPSGGGGPGCGAVDQAFANLTPAAVGDPFTYADFSSTAGLTLNGTSAQSGNELTLTTAAQADRGNTFEAGSVFYGTPLAIDAATQFSTSFEFSICNGPSTPSCTSPSADGMTFTLQNGSAGASSLGGIGYQLGYGGIANSVAVAFDTYQIPGILVLVNSDIDAPIAYDSGVSFTPGNYFAWVSYNPSSEVLSVYLNSVDTKPPTPTLTASVNLYSTLVPTLSTTPQMFVGFTGGTGEYYADQDVLNWSFSDSDVAPEPGTMGLVVLGLVGLTLRIRRSFG